MTLFIPKIYSKDMTLSDQEQTHPVLTKFLLPFTEPLILALDHFNVSTATLGLVLQLKIKYEAMRLC